MKNVFHFYDNLVHKLLAEKFHESEAILTKTKALLVLWTATTTVMWFYVLYCFMAYGAHSPVAWGGLLCTILHSMAPVVFKSTQSFPLTGLSISLTGLGFQTVFCFYSGGVYSPAAIWLTFHPVILGFFGSTGWIIFSVLLNTCIIMLLFFLEQFHLLPANTLPDVYRNSMIISSYIGLDLLVAAFTITAIKVNNEKNNELKKSKDLTENLLRILCHDINNPLTIVRISSKHLDNVDPELSLRSANRIRRASEDIQRITESVSSWMAHKDGKIALHKQKIDIQDAIDHIHFSFEDKLKDKDITINFKVSDINLQIIGDRTAIFYQIFNNVISNAIKFSFEKSIIDISIFQSNKFILFKVRDYGVGIKAEMINKIFSPYDRTTSRGTRNEIGTGFGLPIVAAVAERMNGKIVIENMNLKDGNDRGTEVTIFLPGLIKSDTPAFSYDSN